MGRKQREHEIELIREAELIEKVQSQRYALVALWGSLEGDKKWRDKNPYIATMVEKVLKEGE